MPRAPRIDVGDLVYHVINRANGRQTIFHTPNDYQHFERLLKEAVNRFGMRLLAYALMPNHWHIVLQPKEDGDLSIFMQWLTLTHTQQYHVKTETIGHGHIYQGRYKSFLVDSDRYLLAVIKYVERNPVRARIVRTVESWKWGSGYRKLNGTPNEQTLITPPPIDLPDHYRVWVNQPEKEDELEDVRISVNKGKPFGSMKWTERMVRHFGLELTTRKPGRPKKGT